MVIKLKNGPFKHLDGSWHFIELSENACKIEFKLNYEFANSFLEKIIAPVFNRIAATFVDGFVARAGNIYKKDLVWPTKTHKIKVIKTSNIWYTTSW